LKGREHRDERRAKIMSLIKGGFDFREMSKRILGKTWRQINDRERDRFTELMTKLLENVYIGKLEGYSGQAIEFVAEIVKDGRAQVTTLVENNNEKIPVHYIMNKADSGWVVYDINIEGVSLVSNYREQFKSILRKDDFEGLVKMLEDKNRSFNEEG
jgi:phospholipid transport system substrate-binding protein